MSDGTIGFDFAAGLGRSSRWGSAAAWASSDTLALAAGSVSLASPGHTSIVAIETLRMFVSEKTNSDPLADIEAAINQVVRSLRVKVESDPAREMSATSLTAIFCGKSQLAVAHIGKMRAYVLRNGNLDLITRDHTIERMVLDAGMSPEEIPVNINRYALVKYIDGSHEAEFDFFLHDVKIGDRILLCADSVWQSLPHSMIRHLMSTGRAVNDVVESVLARLTSESHLQDAICALAEVISLPRGDDMLRSPIFVRTQDY